MRILAAAAAAVVGAVASAPACHRAVPAGPPELRLGVDACDGCGMAIDDPRYAAAARTDDGAESRVLKFDDPGCLARWEAVASAAGVRHRWVHDRASGAWIDADAATFARVNDLVTPMGSGIAAFRSRAEADTTVAEHGGEVMSWNEILGRARDGSLAARPVSQSETPR